MFENNITENEFWDLVESNLKANADSKITNNDKIKLKAMKLLVEAAEHFEQADMGNVSDSILENIEMAENDPVTKNLTPEQMVENLKQYGIPIAPFDEVATLEVEEKPIVQDSAEFEVFENKNEPLNDIEMVEIEGIF